MTNEELFFKEFNAMVLALKAYNGPVNIYDIPLPDIEFRREYHDIAFIQGIETEYYEKLNNTEALIWKDGKLKKRKFDYKGEYILDKEGNVVIEEVTLPQDCIAIISEIQIGVPYKFKSNEPFAYVDMVKRDDKVYYVYIVPKKYCYKVNQTALVINTNKMRVYYQGIGLVLKNGTTIYLYVVPYKPTQKEKGYRVLCSHTNTDYSNEFVAIRDYWLQNNYMFNPTLCNLYEGTKGRTNMALIEFPTVLDAYERFNIEKPMSNDSLDEFDIDYGIEDEGASLQGEDFLNMKRKEKAIKNPY